MVELLCQLLLILHSLFESRARLEAEIIILRQRLDVLGRRARRPMIDREIRQLIRQMSRENPLWGAPRIHGELLMLGIRVAQSTVAKFIDRPRQPPSQSWKTSVRNQAAGIASIDQFVVLTVSFKLVYGLVILRHARRRLVTISVTTNPTAR